MHVFNLEAEKAFSPEKHIEKILGAETGGDFTVACWEPGQASPYHCHPYATEIYFCYSGGGTMRTPGGQVKVKPGSFVVHPPGEMHEYVNGAAQTLLFRVRYGSDMAYRTLSWRGHPEWRPSAEDIAYFAENPVS